MLAPSLTIGVPTYRGVGLVQRFLESWAHADGHETTECVILDDGSPPDDVLDILELTRNYHAEYARHAECRGCVAGYNTIFKQARAPIVALFDNDTRVPKTWIPSAIGLYHAIRPVGVLSWASKGIDDPEPPPEHPLLEPATELAGYSFMLAIEKWIAVGGFDESMRHFRGDSDMCCALAYLGMPSFRVHYPLVEHEGHATIAALRDEVRADLKADDAVFREKWGDSSSKVERRLLARLRLSGVIPNGERRGE